MKAYHIRTFFLQVYHIPENPVYLIQRHPRYTYVPTRYFLQDCRLITQMPAPGVPSDKILFRNHVGHFSDYMLVISLYSDFHDIGSVYSYHSSFSQSLPAFHISYSNFSNTSDISELPSFPRQFKILFYFFVF